MRLLIDFVLQSDRASKTYRSITLTAVSPNFCWYYTDPSRTQGFWDVCQ